MIVINSSFVLLIFSINFFNVAIRLVADNYKHLSRFYRFDGLCKLLDLPLLAGFSVRSPVIWLDAVEEDSSILDEFKFGREFSIVLLVELPVDVDRLSVVIFELLWICSIVPVSFEDAIVVYG